MGDPAETRGAEAGMAAGGTRGDGSSEMGASPEGTGARCDGGVEAGCGSGLDGFGRGAGGGPVVGAAESGLPDDVVCPFCDGSDTELHSAFGGQLSTATYWCRRCRTAFEWFKWERR